MGKADDALSRVVAAMMPLTRHERAWLITAVSCFPWDDPPFISAPTHADVEDDAVEKEEKP